jgi:hypothetical protein
MAQALGRVGRVSANLHGNHGDIHAAVAHVKSESAFAVSMPILPSVAARNPTVRLTGEDASSSLVSTPGILPVRPDSKSAGA